MGFTQCQPVYIMIIPEITTPKETKASGPGADRQFLHLNRYLSLLGKKVVRALIKIPTSETTAI